MIIVLMGVTGAGKTTVGEALAKDLGWRLADADDYHSTANIAKMRAGIPLTDEDRAPWLQALHDAVVAWLAAGENIVLACSALKATYRNLLLASPDVKLVYLRGNLELFAARMAARHNHFMNPQLLRSQLETLEEPKDALTVDASLTKQQIVAEIRGALVP